MKIWILTSECNEYDQFGEYYVAAFKDIPSNDQLSKHCKQDGEEFYAHMYNGGGRRGYEDMWYNLTEVEL